MTASRTGPALAALLLVPALAAPRPAAAQAPAEPRPIVAHYAVQAAGMTVMELRATFDLREGGYEVELASRLRGVAAAFGEGGGVTRVSGAWSAGGVRPGRYAAEGRWGGEPRRTVLEWRGEQPLIRTLLPLEDVERELVPEAARLGTVDGISAAVALVRQVQRDGRCDSRAAVFDGRRRTEMAAATEGWVTLPAERGAWSGRALRCRFEGRVTAGFRVDGRDVGREPQTGTAWLAEVRPGLPPIPVRVESPTRWFGTLTARLVSVEDAPLRQAAGPG